MATYSGKIRVVTSDLAMSLIGAINGAAANVGAGSGIPAVKATDAILIVNVYTAPGGAPVLVIQGSNLAAFASPVTVTPDKGPSLALPLSTGTYVYHLANLQFAQYRVTTSGGATTGAAANTWLFHPVEDSFDATTA